MHNALLDGRIAETPWGPRLGVRWWRFGAGVLLGLACATKWSGLYFVMFFGLMSVAFDVAARRQYRVPRPWLGTIRRDVGPAAVRDGADPVRGVPGVVLDVVRVRDRGRPVRSGAHDRRARLVSAAGRDPVAVALHLQGVRIPFRPDQFGGQPPPVGIQTVDLADVVAAGAVRDRPAERRRLRRTVVCEGRDDGRHARDVVVAVPVLAYAVWRAFVRRDWRYAVVLVGYCAGFLPWFADIDRQMYFFYAVAMAPFLVMAIALICGDILYKPAQGPERRTLGVLVGVLLHRPGDHQLRLVVPGADGHARSRTGTWNMEIWLPSWR